MLKTKLGALVVVAGAVLGTSISPASAFNAWVAEQGCDYDCQYTFWWVYQQVETASGPMGAEAFWANLEEAYLRENGVYTDAQLFSDMMDELKRDAQQLNHTGGLGPLPPPPDLGGVGQEIYGSPFALGEAFRDGDYSASTKTYSLPDLGGVGQVVTGASVSPSPIYNGPSVAGYSNGFSTIYNGPSDAVGIGSGVTIYND